MFLYDAELEFVSGSALGNRKVIKALKECTFVCIQESTCKHGNGVMCYDMPTGVCMTPSHERVSIHNLAANFSLYKMLVFSHLSPQPLIRKGDVVLVRDKVDPIMQRLAFVSANLLQHS